MPPQVPPAFVSYSRDDADFALQLVLDLKRAGVNIWMDKLDIRAGRLWDSAIEEAVNGCARILVILSPSSVNSPNVMAEVSFAMDEQKEIIPVLYRPCRIPFRLRRIEYIDLSNDQEYPRRLEELVQIMAMEQSLGHLASAVTLDTPPDEPTVTLDPPVVVQRPIAPPPPPIVQRPAATIAPVIVAETKPTEKRFKLPTLEHAPQVQDPVELSVQNPTNAPVPATSTPPHAKTKFSLFLKSPWGKVAITVCSLVVVVAGVGVVVSASKLVTSSSAPAAEPDPTQTAAPAAQTPVSVVDTRLVGKWTGQIDNEPASMEFTQGSDGIQGSVYYDASHDPKSPDHVSEVLSVTQNQDQVTLTGTSYRDLDNRNLDFKLDTIEVRLSTDGTKFAGNLDDPYGNLQPIEFVKSQ